MKNTATLDNRRKYNQRVATKRPRPVMTDGEITAESFLNKHWFLTLAESIYTEIERLKVCTIRQLVTGKFKDENRYHFATALESLSGRLNIQQRGLFTQYSINPDVVTVKIENRSWKEKALADKPKSKPQPDFLFEDFTR